MIHLRIAYILLIQLILSLSLSAQVDFLASDTEGCTPFHVKFSINQSTVDMDTISRIDWHFGRGDSLIAIDPDTVIFEYEGDYTIVMLVNGDRENAIVKTDFITVRNTVSAAFQYEEYMPDFNFRFIPIEKISDPAATYFYSWEYDKIDGSDYRSKDYVINIDNQLIAVDTITLDTGTYSVSLTIDDSYGCYSDYSQRLFIAQEIQIANIFFPEVEEFLIIDSQNLNTVLKFQVYNRYGLLVYTHVAREINWNGKTSQGAYLNSGVYFYILESVESDAGGKFNQQGFIHLYR